MTSELSISVITPTADQPTGLRLLEGYMQRQTMQPAQWIVADDGLEPATLHCGQQHVVRKRVSEGGASLAMNILAGLEVVKGNVIAICEHDDWYSSTHLELLASQCHARGTAAGSIKQRYYNVATRQFRLMNNIGSALCNTVFDSELIPFMRKACERAIREGRYCVDRFFWDSLAGHRKALNHLATVVGIKGLPGRKGLGLGHRPDKLHWASDPALTQLEQWIGKDVRHYGDFYQA